MSPTEKRSGVRGLLAIVCVLLLTVVFAACGDDNDSSNGGSSGGSDTTATDGGSGSDIVAEANAAVEEAKAPVTEWRGPSETPTPPKDKFIYIIACSPDTEGCQRHTQAAQEAAKVLGWRAELIQTNGTPQEFVSAMNEGMDQGVDAILGGSLPFAAIKQPLARAEEEGIPVVTMIGGNETPEWSEDFKGGLYADVDTDNLKLGAMAANWAIAQTDGKAKVGILNEKDFPILGGRIQGFTEALDKCPDCEVVKDLNVPVSVLAKEGAPTVASFLRANPDVNYMFGSYDGGSVFAVQGIKQAGKAESVALVGQDANEPNFGFIRAGDVQTASAGASHEWIGWAAVDDLIRAFNNEAPAPEWNSNSGEGIPGKLFDKTNLPPEGEKFLGDLDFKAKFKELWGL